MVPISLEFLRLQDRCFATSPDNISALGSLATENQRLMEQAEIASRSDMMTTSEAIACASIASNIVQLSSCVIESNYAIQDLCTEFLKKTRFFSPNLNTYTSSIEPSSTIDRCPKPINLTQHGLRKWCKSHLSYLFPTNKQVAEFSMISEMSESQVSSWFRNARTRSGWSKLFSDKVHVNRDPSRLDIVFQDYNSYILSHCHSDICERLSYDVHFRLVDKVWRWFHTDKNCKKLEGSGSVRPWVKTVLFKALDKAKESCISDFNSKDAHPFSGFNEPPTQSFFTKKYPHSDSEDTASESSSSTNSRCSTLSCLSCELVSGSSSGQPSSSSSTLHHVTTPSSTSSDYLPASNSSNFQSLSPSRVSSDLSTSDSHDYQSPPDLTFPLQSSPPSLLTSHTLNPVEIINGLDALFKLDCSSGSPHQLPPPHSKYPEASTLPSDFFLGSLREFALPSSSSTNSQETAELESGQFDDASEN